MSDSSKPIPTQIELHQKSRVLEIGFSDGMHFRLPFEFLRVHSPSAEVRGHGPGQETLQVGKKEVEITWKHHYVTIRQIYRNMLN